MRSRTYTQLPKYPGYTTRLAKSVLTNLERLDGPLKLPTTNRLLSVIVSEIVELSLSSTFHISTNGILAHSRTDASNLAVWMELDSKDVRRSRPMSETQLIKLTFNTESYKRLAEISRYLRWAEGQVVIEAIHAFFLLAGAKSALELPPDIVLLTRAQLAYRGKIASETAASICRPLNEGLGFLAPLDTSVPVAAEQPIGLLPPLTGFV